MDTNILGGMYMSIYKFIKIRGADGARTGYFVPRLYQLDFSLNVLKAFGLPYVKERLDGWSIWWVENEDDFKQAIKTLDELKKTRIFEYKVSE
jgi:hypothetical protein